MKKKIFYVMVVALAITLSSFSLSKKSAYGNYYWFPLELGSGHPLTVNHLVYQSFDPYQCLNWGMGGYCSGAFLSYSGTCAPYSAAGMEVLVDFHIY
ncbi:MAG TPA: hypothetical protein VF939_25770 [Puia sp.]